jgi:hypothetical protein
MGVLQILTTTFFWLASLAQVGEGVFRFWAKPKIEKHLRFFAGEAS